MVLQRIFSIPTDKLLLTFLAYSKPLRDFCGFTKVPDASKITRFKQDFLNDLQSVFDNLVNLTEPICQTIDSAKADMTIFDSSGIEAFVMSLSLALLPMVLELSAIFPFITKTLWILILKLLLIKNRILRTKINPPMIQNFLFPP